MKDIVSLKGDREGLFLVVDPEWPFSGVLSALAEKLEISSEFFVKTPKPPLVRYKGERNLTVDEGEQLCALLDHYGLIYTSDFLGAQATGEELGYTSEEGWQGELFAPENEDGGAANVLDFRYGDPQGEFWEAVEDAAGEEQDFIDALARQPWPEISGHDATGAEEGEYVAAAAAALLETDAQSRAGETAAVANWPEEQPPMPDNMLEGDTMTQDHHREDKVNGYAEETVREEAPDQQGEPEEVLYDKERDMSEFIFCKRSNDLLHESVVHPALTIYRTIRGGQEVRYAGTVIIFGDVNPTARVIAENDIFVAGITRGVLHAGCKGDRSASIAAGNFGGGQVRIADLIVRAPDELAGSVGFGVACIHNGQLEIQTIRR